MDVHVLSLPVQEELLAEATEGRMDESKRAALHSRWADAQEAKQIRELLNAIKNGFKRKRRLGAGLEGDEDEVSCWKLHLKYGMPRCCTETPLVGHRGLQSGQELHAHASSGGAQTITTIWFAGVVKNTSHLQAPCVVFGCCAYQDGTDAEARRRRARLLGLADGEGEGGEEDEAVIAGTDRLQRLDFSWRQEDEVDAEAAAAAVAAEQAARQKRQQLQWLTKQASESQQVSGVWMWMVLSGRR